MTPNSISLRNSIVYYLLEHGVRASDTIEMAETLIRIITDGSIVAKQREEG